MQNQEGVRDINMGFWKSMFNVLTILVLALCLFTMGWSGNNIYTDYKHEKVLDGLRFVYNNSQHLALEKARELDSYGDWVCVNVKGMTFERGVEVCQHEMAHELFAEIIENHPDKIEKVMEIINEE